MSKPHSIWIKLDRYPPLLVRLLARTAGGRLMSDDEVLRRSKGQLDRSDLAYLAYALSWERVPVGQMRAFVIACGVDFADPARMRSLNRYLKTAAFRHLLRSENSQELVDRLSMLLPQ